MSSDNPSLTELLEKGKNALNKKDFKKSFEYFEQALGEARAEGNMEGESSSLRAIGNTYYYLSEIKKAIEYYEKALEIARNIGDKKKKGELEGACIGNLGAAYMDLGEVKKAIEYYEKALEIAQDIEDRKGKSYRLRNIGNAYEDLGKIKKAIEYYEKALEIARAIGDREIEGACIVDLGAAYKDLGEIKKAIEYYEKALEIARAIGDRDVEGACIGNLGAAYMDLGEVKKGIEYYEKALAIARAIGDREGEGVCIGNLGAAYMDLGEVKKAIEYYKKALEIARDIGNKKGEGIWTSKIGEVELITGEWNSSLKLLSESLELFKSLENPIKQADVLTLIGDLKIKSGDWEDARINLNESIELYEKTAPHMKADVLVGISELNILKDRFDYAYDNLKSAYKIVSQYELDIKKIPICIKFGHAKLIEYEKNGIKENISTAKSYIESALKLTEKFQKPLMQGISLRELGILYSKDNRKDESYKLFQESLEIFRKIKAEYEIAKTYFEFARIIAENNELTKAEEMAKICAFYCLDKNFKELEIDTYMLLGDIAWKQDTSQFGYYLKAFEKATFNTRIYVKIFFLLIERLKRMDKSTCIDFIKSLKAINKEIQIDSFFESLLLIEGYLFSWDEVPGNDSGRLIEFLKQEFGISWVETAKIEKIDNGRSIRVTAEKNYLSLVLNNEKAKVNLKIDDGRSAEFIVKSENGKLNIQVEDADYSGYAKGLPEELIKELSDFEIPKN